MDIPRDNQEWTSYIETLREQLPEYIPTDQAAAPVPVHRTIDHTLLSESATEEQIDILCAEANEHEFASVCVRLRHVFHAAQQLRDAEAVAVACVVGFPGGMDETADKAKEAQEAVRLGASELDMVLKYPLLKEREYVDVFDDVVAVRKAAPRPVKLKVILETSQLSRDEIVAGAAVTALAGADFVKTSTGFNGEGATVQDVGLMRAVVDSTGKECRVKASGGIRSARDCVRMLKAGAERIGASSGVRIIEQMKQGEEEEEEEEEEEGTGY